MPSYVNLGNDMMVADLTLGARLADKHISIKEDEKNDFELKRTNLRAVDQSPAPGALLAAGSKVIVFFEDSDDFSPDIFDGAHSGYTGMKASEIIAKVNENDEVKKIVKAGKDYEDLTSAERSTMNKFFAEELGLEIDSTDKTRNSKAAYDALMASYRVIEGKVRRL